MTLLHIIAGLLGLAAGAVALYALKGGRLHRKSGTVFVCAMLFMSASGAVMAALKPERISVIAGALTFYLVTTALLTVRRPVHTVQETGPSVRLRGGRAFRPADWLDAGAMLVALIVGAAGVTLGIEASNSGTGTLDGQPAAPAFIFGAVALLAALGDMRMMLARGLHGARRIARHLWRMCFALFIAAASFFLGQPQVFPKFARDSGLLPIPVLVILALMLYWLARVRFTQRYRRVEHRELSLPSERH